MGYRPCIIWLPAAEMLLENWVVKMCSAFHVFFHAQALQAADMSEWNQLDTEAARREYLRAAVADYVAFTPSAVQADDIYR
ncbi:unnamed protein product [Symbiodinium sp. CCMP2592]|nr:unnamed protein product [Symbiodinium sp. CCMP2592]